MKKSVIILALFAVGGMLPVACGQEWTQFRGPDFGRTTETNIAKTWDDEAVEWKSPLPGRGASSPVVFGGRIYLTAFTGYALEVKEPGDPTQLVRHLLCFDATTGDQLWQRSLAVRSGGSGDATDSHVLWKAGKGANVSSPVYHDGYLYWAKDKGSIVYCVNAETGKVVYQERLKPSSKDVYATPLLVGDRLYYVSRENGIFVVAASPKFKLLAHTKFNSDDSVFAASPAPLSGGSVLLRSDRFLYRLNPAADSQSARGN